MRVRVYARYSHINDHEVELWYKLWNDKGMTQEDLGKLDLTEVLKEADIFIPATKKANLVSLAQPLTTSNIERSTLRLVKTWLRSTMAENCLKGLCIENKDKNVGNVLKRFCQESRRLYVAFFMSHCSGIIFQIINP